MLLRLMFLEKKECKYYWPGTQYDKFLPDTTFPPHQTVFDYHHRVILRKRNESNFKMNRRNITNIEQKSTILFPMINPLTK